MEMVGGLLEFFQCFWAVYIVKLRFIISILIILQLTPLLGIGICLAKVHESAIARESSKLLYDCNGAAKMPC